MSDPAIAIDEFTSCPSDDIGHSQGGRVTPSRPFYSVASIRSLLPIAISIEWVGHRMQMALATGEDTPWCVFQVRMPH